MVQKCSKIASNLQNFRCATIKIDNNFKKSNISQSSSFALRSTLVILGGIKPKIFRCAAAKMAKSAVKANFSPFCPFFLLRGVEVQ